MLSLVFIICSAAARTWPAYTEDGSLLQRPRSTKPRYTPVCPFLRHEALARRRYWWSEKKPRRPSYKWAPTKPDACLKGPLGLPSAHEARAALRNRTVVVAGDSLAHQTWISLGALLLCGGDEVAFEFDDARKGELRIPSLGIKLIFALTRFGLNETHSHAPANATRRWFDGKKWRPLKHADDLRLVDTSNPAGLSWELEAVLKNYSGAPNVTYLVNYGHWYSAPREDVDIIGVDGGSLLRPEANDADTSAKKARRAAYSTSLAYVSTRLRAALGPRSLAFFLGYSPSAIVKPEAACGDPKRDKWSAAQRSVATGGGVYLLDAGCPISYFPRSAHIKGDHNHFHLPGPPDYVNAIALRAGSCALERGGS